MQLKILIVVLMNTFPNLEIPVTLQVASQVSECF